PAAAARAAGDGAVFVAAVAEILAGGIVLLGGKRAAANARRIRLYDADHVVDEFGGHTRAAGDADAGAVTAGDKRIRSVVDIEERALGTFKQQAFAGFGRREEELGGVADVWLEALGVGGVFADDCRGIEWFEFVGRIEHGEHAIFGGNDVLDLGGKL